MWMEFLINKNKTPSRWGSMQGYCFGSGHLNFLFHFMSHHLNLFVWLNSFWIGRLHFLVRSNWFFGWETKKNCVRSSSIFMSGHFHLSVRFSPFVGGVRLLLKEDFFAWCCLNVLVRLPPFIGWDRLRFVGDVVYIFWWCCFLGELFFIFWLHLS